MRTADGVKFIMGWRHDATRLALRRHCRGAESRERPSPFPAATQAGILGKCADKALAQRMVLPIAEALGIAPEQIRLPATALPKMVNVFPIF